MECVKLRERIAAKRIQRGWRRWRGLLIGKMKQKAEKEEEVPEKIAMALDVDELDA